MNLFVLILVWLLAMIAFNVGHVMGYRKAKREILAEVRDIIKKPE